MLAHETGSQRAAPAPFRGVNQARGCPKFRRQHLALAGQLRHRSVHIRKEVAVARVAPGGAGLERPIGCRPQRAFEVDALIALPAPGQQNRVACSIGALHRLVVKIHEKAFHLNPDRAVHGLGADARNEAALRLRPQQAAPVSFGFRVGVEIDLGGLDGIAHAGVQRQAVQALARRLEHLPLPAERAAESIDPLAIIGRCDRVGRQGDAGFLARLVGVVPAQPGKQAGVGRQLVAALCVHAKESAPITQIDLSLRRDGFKVGSLCDSIEQDLQRVSEALRACPPDQEVDAGGHVQPRHRSNGDVRVQEQFAQPLRLSVRLQRHNGAWRPGLRAVLTVNEGAHTVN